MLNGLPWLPQTCHFLGWLKPHPFENGGLGMVYLWAYHITRVKTGCNVYVHQTSERLIVIPVLLLLKDRPEKEVHIFYKRCFELYALMIPEK